MTSIANNDIRVQFIKEKIIDIQKNLLTIKKELNNSITSDKSTVHDYNNYFENKKDIKLHQINALKNIYNYLNDSIENNDINIDNKRKIEKDIFYIKQTIQQLSIDLDKNNKIFIYLIIYNEQYIY